MRDIGLLGLRLTLGGYLAGHGAQKLFGAFGGQGLSGAAGAMSGLGLEPGEPHALAAGVAELGGGALTAAGLLSPLGPIAVMGPMAVAAGTVHRRRALFTMQGGPELPLVDFAAALALAALGPGSLSLDSLLGVRVPRALVAVTAAGVGAVAAYAIGRNVVHARSLALRQAEEAAESEEVREQEVELPGRRAPSPAGRAPVGGAAPA